MDEQEQPMDEDNGQWAYQLELEQRYFEDEICKTISEEINVIGAINL